MDAWPVGAVENKDWDVRSTPDLITPKLAALHFYQLSIPAPTPPQGGFDKTAVARDEVLFKVKAVCFLVIRHAAEKGNVYP